MTLEGANILTENNDSTIYTMNGIQMGQYCVVIPKNTDNIRMIVDLNMKKSFDSLANNTIDKDTLIKEITEEYNNIMSKYPSGILVLPMIDIDELTNLVNSNDKQKMFDETKKIGSITSEIYKKISDAGVDKSKIDQKIIIVEKTEIDNKFVTWLKEQMPNFVEGINFNELKGSSSIENINPFTGEATEPTPAPTPVDDIFGPTENNESTPKDSPEQSPVVEEPATEKEEQSNDIFTTPTGTTPTEDNQPIAEPQPIENTKLETTQAIPVAEETTNTSVPSEPVSPEQINNEKEELNEIDKKSGGFANLIILAVILIAVTVASIELGKFLYNTFGA
mgnify:CR=1 FL=1